MMTPEQKAAIAAQLGADLSKLDNDQLIELCVLYRAQPSAHDTFPAALATEIDRRFTPNVIKTEGVFYGVLQHFANQFQSPISRFHAALLEMAGTVNRDIWFTDHEALFRSAIDNEEVAAWLVAKAQQDILNKCLRNRLALGYIAQSQIMATAILGDETACALWKDAPDLWQVWPQHRTGIAVVAKSAELTQYILDTAPALAAVIKADAAMQEIAAVPTAMRVVVASQTGMTAVAGSEVAMRAVAASEVAMRAVAASEVAMRAVAASEVAMRAVAASEVAMRAVAASSMALAEIVQTATARAALIAHNDNLQAVRQQIYDTIKTSWKRKVNIYGGSENSAPNISNTMTNPLKTPENALVFACLGRHGSFPDGVLELQHPGGSIAARTTTARSQPTSMIAVDGISFGGAIVFNRTNFGYGYAELWTKE